MAVVAATITVVFLCLLQFVTGVFDYIPRLRAHATSPDGMVTVKVYQQRLTPRPFFPRMGAIARVYDQNRKLIYEDTFFRDSDWTTRLTVPSKRSLSKGTKFELGQLVVSITVIDPAKLFPDGAIMLIILVAALAFSAWHSYRLKFVAMDNNQLYVSSFFKHTVVPFSNVDNIYYSAGFGLVFVRLKSPSVFGSTISFMPTLGSAIRSGLKSPSIVDELRGLVKHASRSVDAKANG